MELQPILMAAVFILVAASLTYIVMNINNPPVTYTPKPVAVSISTTPGSECTAGQEKRCALSGCTGVMECATGYWTECRLERECSEGDARPCQYTSCSDGTQQCGECGKWGPCAPFPYGNPSCNDSAPCNSSGA